MLHPAIRPLAALALLALVAAIVAAVTTLRHGLPWYAGLALFYGSVAGAEIAYLTACLLRRPGAGGSRVGGRNTA
ncbi:hypothetical protein [Methylobacterium oxalidis]|uniref:Uncharacterized protein n=1 Tax=Methylobacterium oxalidis TaxID=944322 RepID=A0A512J4R6_9HYPH|nr:hypothetical protein [Methylobacterium oxalidis]GEP04955.1 hypothetical protein MOX02_29930 [Methylobacterium oxalidis]GJE35531.1 hypothetical protein LDDCCGHA_5750 [Methylobacterium oxalidis]GLS63692.1 hypothetical protein GCM10007888_20730 [Methylobacterium oxalidis]